MYKYSLYKLKPKVDFQIGFRLEKFIFINQRVLYLSKRKSYARHVN